MSYKIKNQRHKYVLQGFILFPDNEGQEELEQMKTVLPVSDRVTIEIAANFCITVIH